jgi:hypothetical protein
VTGIGDVCLRFAIVRGCVIFVMLFFMMFIPNRLESVAVRGRRLRRLGIRLPRGNMLGGRIEVIFPLGA